MDDVPADLAEALRDRYPIERRLGSGGMATVYLARDLKHDRLVALKVLRAELAATVGPERFEREIRFSARLQHPHILPVLDSGQSAGRLWFTMPYVRGETLRERVRRLGQLPVEDALRITTEALQALGQAHAEGIIHRDIKPENILLTQDGSTLVADFGIARALGSADTSLTEPGLAPGTPAYMSPEQAAAGPLDERSDLYSVACLCYEMLAGEPPYTGPAQTIIAKRFSDPVPSVKRLRSTVPDAVDAALQRALARAPADRFRSAADFTQALQRGTRAAPRGARLAAALGAAFLLGLGGVFVRGHVGLGAGKAAGPRLLAVLPFENLGDSADRYFADGVTDEVRTKLSRVAGIEVIARASSNQYRGTAKPPQQIARELGVDYLLTATVRWAKTPGGGASRVRVIPELVEVRPGRAPRTAWEEPFDAALTDVFQVQAEIAGKVAGALDVALADSTRRRLASRPTKNLQAYDALLRGDKLLITEGKTDLASARAAADAYREAVRLDSNFAIAWSRLARAEMLRFDAGESANVRDSLARVARAAADRALALAPDRPEAYLAIGLVRAGADLDAAGALTVLERARSLGPTDVDVLSVMASMLVLSNDQEQAAARFAEAARLDPRSLLVIRRYARTLIYLSRGREADSVATVGLRIAPDNFELIGYQAVGRLLLGDSAGARGALQEALRHATAARLIRNLDPWLLWVNDSLQALALTLPWSAFADERAEGLLRLSQVQWDAHRYVEARANGAAAVPLLEAQRVTRPADPRVPDLLGSAYALSGRRAEALAEIERWRALVRATPNSPGWMGHRLDCAVYTGQVAEAVALLDSLMALPGGPTRKLLKVIPFLDPLRRDPSFQRLVNER